MRSIRMRWLLSIGSIFLIIALLSYYVPHFFVSRDIDSASTYLNNLYTQYQQRLRQLSGSWITYRFVGEAAKLDAVSQMMQVNDQTSWKLATSVISQDPDIALVQVTSKDRKTALISPESAYSYTPKWARDSKQRLWIEIPQKEKFFLATALRQDSMSYLLYEAHEEEKESQPLEFTQFETQLVPETSAYDSEKIYEALQLKERILLEKTKMIQELVPFESHAAGILRVDDAFKKGKVLLSEELFSSEPLVGTNNPNQKPFIIYRKEGPYIDLMQFATQSAPYVAIGYSLSSIAGEIARTVNKPVMIYNHGALLQGFSAEGRAVASDQFTLQKGKVLYEEMNYIPNNIAIGPLTFSVLIPEAEAKTIQKVLSKVKSSLVNKISSNLLLLSVGLFAVSMISLTRITKRLTKPITQLARASEEIGKGKYEGLDLPSVEKRHDEVAVLSHSFQKMVDSLRDREKMRGVLNKVVSKEIASTILNSNIELGGEQRVLTMLFSDIRGFTPLSEVLPPPKLIQLLNSYMTRMCRIIDETHGVVDKFVGDEIMALYGAPLAMHNHAERAVEAALLMMEELVRWNKERGENETHLQVGMGIHTGAAFAGNMGAEDRLNYTVVGANVNLAARLCSAAKPMQILISEETYKAIAPNEKFHFRQLDPIPLKGFDNPVPIYEAAR